MHKTERSGATSDRQPKWLLSGQERLPSGKGTTQSVSKTLSLNMDQANPRNCPRLPDLFQVPSSPSSGTLEGSVTAFRADFLTSQSAFLWTGKAKRSFRGKMDVVNVPPKTFGGRKEVVSGFGVRDSEFGIRDSGFGFRDLGFGFRDSGFGIRVSGFGFRDLGFGGLVSGCRPASPFQ